VTIHQLGEYRARAEVAIQRANALTIRCEYCKADPNRMCFDPRTGYELELQPAHTRRLRDAQVVR
jgi:hypothetical protein